MWALVSVIALLSDSRSPNLVRAGFQTVDQGVVRIDLEKKYLNHLSNIMLSDDIDVDSMVQVNSKERQSGHIDLLLDANESNYSYLREVQRKHAHKQHSATQLAQNDQAASEGNLNGVRVRVKQLVSESADTSIDNKDDL